MSQLIFYNAWFCPYAQRVWCTLNELGVPHEIVEALHVDPITQEYVKEACLLAVNPDGLVPTLVETREVLSEGEGEERSGGKRQIMCGSLNILRTMYQRHAKNGGEQENERLSFFSDHAEAFDRKICSPFYRVLMRRDGEERVQAWKDVMSGLTSFCDRLEWRTEDGPSNEKEISFYAAEVGSEGHERDRPSQVDFAVFPWVYRLYIIEHFKGLRLPERTEEEVALKRKLTAWQQKMESLPSVHRTLADSDELTKLYNRYADGTAKSKVGDAVRKGKEAHSV